MATATTTQLLANSATYGGQLLVPLFLIVGRGVRPVKAGLMSGAARVLDHRQAFQHDVRNVPAGTREGARVSAREAPRRHPL